MRVIAGAMLAGGLLAACAGAPDEGSTPGPQAWRCDADDARSLIGSHIGVVTFPRDAEVRNVCTTCAATEDHRPNRLNLRFDEATGIIRSVDCG